MALLSPADQDRLRESFAEMTSTVRVLFFTQAIGCDTCVMTKQILDELPRLSDRIAVEELNVVIDADKAKQYGIDRAPGLALVGQDGKGAEHDSRIRFLGAPSGYELASLVHAVMLVGGRPSSLSEENRARVEAVDTPVTLRVFTTPTCPHCPGAVGLAHEMAFASRNITAYAVEATEFPDLARRYRITGVPKTVVNEDEGEILGALPQDAFVEQALGPFKSRTEV